jgi:hypothetical protein
MRLQSRLLQLLYFAGKFQQSSIPQNGRIALQGAWFLDIRILVDRILHL